MSIDSPDLGAATGSDTADLQRIAPRVVRAAIPLPLPDLKVINAYLVAGDDGVTLIDPGWACAESEEKLLAALDTLGYTRSDVRRILATHAHWDHYSLAVKWRHELGVELALGSGERHSISSFDPDRGLHPAQVGMLTRAGAPELARQVRRLKWQPYERDVAFTPPDRWLEDGDRIDCGGITLTVRSTPGHTRGHVVFADEANRLMFTGDHLLPRITPSIGFEDSPEPLPLRSFLSSLRLVLDLPEHRMLPAHGGADRTTTVRAAELIEHHRDRLALVADLVAARGQATAYEIATRMRWTRHDRPITDLDPIHRMVAVIEVMSHLDLLVHQGTLAEDTSHPASVFQPA
ncbi:Zn-dependent hydrolase, glyoxylase [Mycolicibacterium thermoresistibile]|uniref:MBL fold metallo-hydrolase n=1 Tax=Mycolicibacterium thermoresistibile TaxID=1797 RepID=UPI0002E6AA2A|nr:MBL fold metallo-hydrolase [Mycolicibacterium thermoresistibile]SNW16613.1 Zn-dependent hydrolase, glyoxylase [Mycolicibacterium thermoresistibile]